MRVWLVRTLSGFLPADDESRRVLAKFPTGTTFPADVKTRESRSGPWHRRYWLLMSRLAEAVDRVNIRELGDAGPAISIPVRDAESLHTALKFICGLCEKYTVESGGETHLVRVPKSTDFEHMTPDEWAAYWPVVLQAVHERVLPGVEDRYLEDELARLAS